MGEARMTTPKATGRERTNMRRERRRRGWSENDTAIRLYNLGIEHGIREDQLGVDARAVSRWELGRTQPNQTYTALLSLLYDLPPEQLDLPPVVLPVGFPQPPTVTTIAPADLVEVATAPFPAVDSDPVKRREFIKLGGLGVAALAAGAIDAERLAAVLAGAGVDEQAIDGVESLTRNLMRLEATTAPQSLLPTVAGHLGAFRELFFRAPAGLLPRVYSLAGETALLGGWLALKLERREGADRYWTDADRFAEIAGDVNLQAALLVCRGLRYRSYRRRDEGVMQAVRFYERAGALLGRSPDPAAAALFYSDRADCYARAAYADGRGVGAAMHDLDAGLRHLDRMDDGSAPLYVFESIRGDLAHTRGVALLYLGRPREAAAEFEKLLSSLGTSSPSWRSGITACLGAAHARLGAVEQACDMLVRAHGLAVESGSPYRMRNVYDITQEYLAGIDAPAVRRLEQEIGSSA
jgi:tetratricopeptide (TPR) repeat protein